MNELSARANIQVLNYNNKSVVVYEDHRYILNVLHFMKQEKIFKEPLNLIYFDYHDDARKPSAIVKKNASAFRKAFPPQMEFFKFTEFDLCALDNDWLLAGMELNFINNAILIGAVEKSMSASLNGKYIDHVGQEHLFFAISHLWDCLGNRGCLGDIATDYESNKIREIMSFNTNDNPRGFKNVPNHPYILDIDCDVYWMNILGKTMAWPAQRMRELF